MKNKVLKAITSLVVVVLVVSACYLDLESNVPHIICLVCFIWLFWFVGANWDRIVRCER